MSRSNTLPARLHEPVPAPPSSRRPKQRPNLAPWLMLSPAGLVIFFVTIVPIGFLVFSSFTNYDQRSLFTGEFSLVGLDQYRQIFTDSAFWASLGRTAWFTIAIVLATLVIGIGVAQLMTRIGTVVRYIVTIVLIFAWAMPNVASSMVWNWLFQPGYGVVNWMLTKLHIFGNMTSTAWANHTGLAFLSIGLLIVWQAVPFIALTVYAAMTQLPESPLEAARIDGASELRIWWSIKMPYLRPTVLLVTILSIIWDTNVFNQIWLVSAGGPGDSTSTLGVFTYKKAFVGFDVGTGAAISVVTTVLLIGVTSLYIRNLLHSGEDL